MSFYDSLCNMLIRPARQTYSDYDLGPPAIGSLALRQNFTFTSSENHTIKASFYKQRASGSQPCVLYLHSFNGSRLEPLSFVPDIIKKGFHFCSMDFAGCGNSGGEFVSLGYHQRWDAIKLLHQVRQRWGIREFIVWGRSMGAVTAVKLYTLLLQEQGHGRFVNMRILGLILDSAFISLKRMVVEVGQSRINVPQFLIKAIFLMVKSSIEERANFKIDELQLSSQLQKVKCPVLLLASKEDTFVSYHHSEEIFSRLPLHQHKQLQYTSGEHYEQRNSQTIETILKFIDQKSKLLTDSPRQLRISNLRMESSVEKPVRSIRKNEIKKSGQPEIAQEQQIQRPCSGDRGQTIMFTNVHAHEFISVGSEKRIDSFGEHTRHYQTQKKIDPPQIKITIGGKEVRAKDGLRSKSKPTFSGKNIEILPRGRQQRSGRDESNEHTQEYDQQNHYNIISGKLRKRGRTQKDQIEFQYTREEKPHVNKIRFESNAINIKSTTLIQEPEPPQKISMTAQEYKNNQVNILKGVIRLSPTNKKKLTKTRGWEQSKSMSNLLCKAQTFSSTSIHPSQKLNLLQALQPCITPRKNK